MPAADEKSIAPGGVCPFIVPVDKAGGLFSKWLGGKIFTPKKAKLQARPESFKGIYLPYWTFDAMTSSAFSGRAGYDKMVKRGDQTVLVTDWKPVSGVYQEFFNDYTVVGTDKSENSLVGRAEPFDFSQLVPYRPELLAGFGAERYSIGLKDAWMKAQEGIRGILYGKISQYICSVWRANRSDSVAFSTQFSRITFKYISRRFGIILTYKGKLYQFVVNGRPEESEEKLVSALRVIIAIIIVLAILGLLGFLMSL